MMSFIEPVHELVNRLERSINVFVASYVKLGSYEPIPIHVMLIIILKILSGCISAENVIHYARSFCSNASSQ